MIRYITALLLLSLIVSCKPDVFPPKPTGYYKIDTPALHEYKVFMQEGFPYTFEYPTYARIEKDTVFAADKTSNPYWINISFPTLGAMMNLTYKQITPEQPLQKLLEDAWKFSFFHHERAEYIDNREFRNPYGTTGILYTVGGNSASRYQFAATDSARNFLRGSLYFETSPNADSLKPATDFLERDIIHMLSTIRWTNSTH